MKKIIQFVAFLTLLLLAFSSCSGGSSVAEAAMTVMTLRLFSGHTAVL